MLRYVKPFHIQSVDTIVVDGGPTRFTERTVSHRRLRVFREMPNFNIPLRGVLHFRHAKPLMQPSSHLMKFLFVDHPHTRAVFHSEEIALLVSSGIARGSVFLRIRRVKALQPKGIDPGERVVHIDVVIWSGGEAKGIRTYVPCRLGVVVAEVVVVQARFGVGVLAGEAEGAVGRGWWRGEVGAPEGGALLPGQGAVRGDQFGGGADQVGDDGVEAGVGLRGVLEFRDEGCARLVGRGVVARLGEGAVGAWGVVPGGVGAVLCGLFR